VTPIAGDITRPTTAPRSPATTGWTFVGAAVVMLLGLIAADVSQLAAWGHALSPVFIGSFLGDIAVVAAAAIGGHLIPASRPADKRNQRATDQPTPANNGAA